MSTREKIHFYSHSTICTDVTAVLILIHGCVRVCTCSSVFIYLFIYNIYVDYFLPYRALLFRCAFLGLLMWSSNFRHGLLKSLLSKYTLFSILYTLYIYTIPSFPSTLLFQTQAYERISQRMRVPPPFYSRNIDITSQDIIDANVIRSFTYSR